MPYKDKEKQKEYWKDKKREQRLSTPEMSTHDVHPEVEMVPALGTLPARSRYLTLSDGQVFDRAQKVEVTKTLTPQDIRRWEAANKADQTIIDPVKAERYRLWREGKTSDVCPIIEALSTEKEREKLRRICQSLARHNVLDRVYYGLREPVAMNEVAELLTAFT